MVQTRNQAEERTLEVIEIYRAEHATWNLERLRSIFADNPTIWRGGRAYEGQEVDDMLVEWANRPGLHMQMFHDSVIVEDNRAAVEWHTEGTDAQGNSMGKAGANVYALENGRIKYLHIYRER